ncbi:MAG: DnaJ domain-containing protein [Deltaproteobacteria bacterium]|nr:DnaJ domain-containing protein [Deltaproteobacteria bacterium]
MNYYELLNIDPKAGPDEIKRAYREKLKEWHPDKNPHRKEKAEEITKTMNIAYGILSDPEQRQNYDRILRFSKGRSFDEYVDDGSFSKKMKKASGALKGLWQDVQDLYSLFKDAVRGRYKLHPVNLGIIGGGLIYFIIPMDIIPDIFPLIGYLDDMAVFTTIINAFGEELVKYRNWKGSA